MGCLFLGDFDSWFLCWYYEVGFLDFWMLWLLVILELCDVVVFGCREIRVFGVLMLLFLLVCCVFVDCRGYRVDGVFVLCVWGFSWFVIGVMFWWVVGVVWLGCLGDCLLEWVEGDLVCWFKFLEGLLWVCYWGCLEVFWLECCVWIWVFWCDCVCCLLWWFWLLFVVYDGLFSWEVCDVFFFVWFWDVFCWFVCVLRFYLRVWCWVVV